MPENLVSWATRRARRERADLGGGSGLAACGKTRFVAVHSMPVMRSSAKCLSALARRRRAGPAISGIDNLVLSTRQV